jgi:hypothetical protein
MLSQVEIGGFFDQCEDALAIEEVLSAYVVWSVYLTYDM